MGRFGVGQPVRRQEDERLITGRGCYTDDVRPANEAMACFVRSPHAHARILRLDAGAARAMPGVLAVLTGDELTAAGLGPLPCKALFKHRDGTPMPVPERPVLAQGRVRFVGDPVAVVVAETMAQARDAAEAVEVEYEPLPAVTDLSAALAPGAPQLWPEAPGNLALDWEAGDRAAVDRLFASAHRITSLELVNNRLVPSPLEPRGCLAEHDPATGGFTLRTGGQGVHSMQAVLAEDILRIPKERLRVIQADVGGGFGMKIFVFPEYPACLWAAKVTGRPVKWIADRSESFLADGHGRDHVTRVQIATDAQGRMTALRASTIANLGAYLSQYGPFIPTGAGAAMYNGVYRFEAVHYEVRCAFTNTVPVDAYRGAGRPEAAYAVERAVDFTARELGLDPAELRRRNFIPPEAMPFRTAMGTTYDSGEFAQLMDEALARADARGFPARRAAARARGRRRGLGLAYYIEQCAGGGDETARLEVTGEGRVRLYIGTQSNGQGHATAYAQILSDALGVPFEAVETVQGDTARVATGRGTGGSRSVPVGGVAVTGAAKDVIANGTPLAADALEAAPADIVFADGAYRIVGTDRTIGLFEVAGRAGEDGLGGSGTWGPEIHTFPNGCHVCEIEVEEATGVPTIVRYVVVDDFGTVVNPLLLEGQVHGGIAQGIGQALLEEAVYEPDGGQLISGSFMDYAMPRADGMPTIEFSMIPVPCRTNPLGMKGAGEAGAIGAPPAVINALVDALADLGVRHVDMPATPLKLWRLIRAHARPSAA
ncbi:MAG TPA: xanthine dehydrogenase family protein molybdopterin-binding subunit [Geminicoccaceae bacterium]|nr:xanthine dehydrogenase family protein molybdopterin-binding subunit [Geminicoccaceae bacterium]